VPDTPSQPFIFPPFQDVSAHSCEWHKSRDVEFGACGQAIVPVDVVHVAVPSAPGVTIRE
jgi:hypothetical protein